MNALHNFTAIASIFISIFLLQSIVASSEQETCSELLQSYEKTLGADTPISFNSTSKPFIFFLHIPRTAGKTYASCFLRSAIPPSQRCSPSYDFLRYNTSQEGCRYLVSHDDYSILDIFPKDTIVVTQLRDPVTRAISAYEFGIEVAARRIHLDEDDFVKSTKDPGFVNTLNVWPWSYIVPWFRADMKRRQSDLKEEAMSSDRPSVWEEHFDRNHNRTFYYNKITNESVWEKTPPEQTLHPYMNPLVMPLFHWIESPEAQELIHNGATLQLLGLTNNSYWPGAAALRRCFFDDPSIQRPLLDIAKRRLRHAVLHVGLTEQLSDSVSSLAAALGISLDSPAYASVTKSQFMYDGHLVDLNQLVSYNSSLDSNMVNETKTVSLLEARRLLHTLKGEHSKLDAKVSPMEQDLQHLVDKEEDYLDKKEANEKKLGYKIRNIFIKIRKRVIQGVTGGTSQATDVSDGGKKEKIESPWGDQIESLDAEIFEMQQNMSRIKMTMDSLQSISKVEFTNQTRDNGRAVLLFDDSRYLEAKNLGHTYDACSANSTQRAKSKRKKAFKHLRTPWDESFTFTSKARKEISAEILQRIRKLNSADGELFLLGKELLQEVLTQQKERGILELLPSQKKESTEREVIDNPDSNDDVEVESVATVDYIHQEL